MGAEKKRLNEMVLTFFVLIYLFIYLSIYSHSCIVVHIFFIHVQVVHMLYSTFSMLKSWPYICCYAGDDVTSFDVTLVTLWHTMLKCISTSMQNLIKIYV